MRPVALVYPSSFSSLPSHLDLPSFFSFLTRGGGCLYWLGSQSSLWGREESLKECSKKLGVLFLFFLLPQEDLPRRIKVCDFTR